ncbi:hypothetical protein D4R52_02405 [bacterium]|nr:MAG: hypothetical protein D4R52_02405 [bacterium]
MMKYWKIIILIILAAVAGWFLVKKFQKPPQKGDDLTAMKNSVVADPVVIGANLTDAQKTKFLADFKAAKKAVVDANFDTLQSLNDLALAKQHLGDLQGAITAWEYTNIIRPKNSLSFANLAALYHYDLHDFAKAEENYKIALENDPADMLTTRNFFELYHYAMKDNAKTEALLMQSIQQNPTAVDLYSLTGSFYEDIGNTQKAIEYYKKYLEINPSNQNVIKALDRLQKGQ